MSDSNQIVLEARNVVKSFPGVRALDGVNLRVRRGRLNALMGENGAGKSTLMKILAGVHPPDDGEVLLEGRPVSFRSTREAQEAGVAIIFQELTLIENLSVAENLFLGREPIKLGLIDFASMHRQARELMKRMGVDIDPGRIVGTLSVALQQVVEIARALSLDSKVLILDEPTSALTAQETESLFRLIQQLKSQGVGLVYITHRFEELSHIADEVTVFRDGRYVDERPFTELDQRELVRMMIGRDADLKRPPGAGSDGAALLTVNSLTYGDPEMPTRNLVENVSLRVDAGEIVGVFGLMGAGRTELLETLFGLHGRHARGEVHVQGQRLTLKSPEQAVGAGMGLAPEDRKEAGLILGMNVAENVTLASLSRYSRLGWILAPRERQAAGEYVRRFNIRISSLDQKVGKLSGGNQQKVVLAKWLATGPKLLMLDEPTRGIDIGAKQEVYTLLRGLAAEGMGLLVVSSEAPELLALCDRILVMCEGRLTAEFSGAEADEHSLLQAALPTTLQETLA